MRYIMKGGTPLAGDVVISGAKNAALGILAAAIMTDETVTIGNLPNVSDINVMLEAMKEIGVVVERIDSHTIKVNGANIHTVVVNNEHIKKIRAGYYLLGALGGKYHHAEVARPGGCKIGERPIDLHLKGFQALGMNAVEEMGMVRVDAPKLVGGNVFMDVTSVGATINIMLAAVLAKGETFIKRAAKEPHVVDVANMLNAMGARVRGAGTDDIRIRGVERLHGASYSIIPDQIEAGTFMFAAAATRGDVVVRNVIPKHLEATSAKLAEIGCEVEE
ncbi:MAG: UDP-N-acetylglucosamine 1-carboxyvinyltransferase, partial [Lachnospiraceae bacterium]|nr:UDP-N-acetylglucosamine 1-carboxyvinyltransferase [Lachnospiraceae bacterium]